MERKQERRGEFMSGGRRYGGEIRKERRNLSGGVRYKENQEKKEEI
jgi:hypothetical protein